MREGGEREREEREEGGIRGGRRGDLSLYRERRVWRKVGEEGKTER